MIAPLLCAFAVGVLVGGAAVIVISATMLSSQCSRDEEQQPAPLPWFARIRSRWQ